MFLALAAALALAAPADAPQDGKLYVIKAVHSGKALAPDGDSIVQAEAKPADAAQHWKLTKVGEVWRITHAKTGKTVTVPDEAEDATPLTLAEPKRGERQQWTLTKSDKGFTVKGKATGQVWDVNEASADDGAKLIQYPAKEGDDAANQTFELVPVEGK